MSNLPPHGMEKFLFKIPTYTNASAILCQTTISSRVQLSYPIYSKNTLHYFGAATF